MRPPPPDFMPLRLALYGPRGLFPAIRRADVRRAFRRIVRRRSSAGRRVDFVAVGEVERLRLIVDLVG